MGVYEIPADKLIGKLAAALSALPEVKAPKWLAYTKSGAHAERAPDQPDFWQRRCASLLRKLYLESPVGVGSLRMHYGGRRKRGSRPEKHVRAGGSIIRKALQQLEALGFVEKKKDGRHLTRKGKSFVDTAAKS